MLAAGQEQRIDQPVAQNWLPLDAVKLRIDEADVERGVVNHKRRVADEFQELLDHFREQRLAGKELAGQAVHGKRFRWHVALGIDVAVKGLPRRHAVEYLDAADRDQAVAAQRIEASGFSIENDFAHGFQEPELQANHTRRCGILTTSARMSRIAVRTGSSPCDVSTTKSARLRFSASGNCRARMPSSASDVMVPRARMRSRCASGSVETTTTASTRFSPPVSNNSGISITTTGAPDLSASSRNFRREAPSIG